MVSAYDRIMARTERVGDCLVFTGSHIRNGYGQVKVDGSPRLVHRVVWETFRGPIPAGMVLDHVCGNRACVSPSHLRVITRKGNVQAAVRLNANNSSGFRGVSYDKSRALWLASVRVDGRLRHLGRFSTAEEAAEAARLGRLKFHEAHSLADMKAVA